MTTNLPTVHSQSAEEIGPSLPSNITPDHRKTNTRTKIFSELPPLPSDRAFRSLQTQPKENEPASNQESAYQRKKRRLSQSVQTKTRRKLNLSASTPNLSSSAARGKTSSWKYTSTAPGKFRTRKASSLMKDLDKHLKAVQDLDEQNLQWENQARIKRELDFNTHMLSQLAKQMNEKNSEGALVLSKIANRNEKLCETLYSSHKADHKRSLQVIKANKALMEKEQSLQDHFSRLQHPRNSNTAVHQTQSSEFLESKLSEKIDNQNAEIADSKKELLRLQNSLQNRERDYQSLENELKRVRSKLISEDGRSVRDLFISEDETRFLFVDNIPLDISDNDFWIEDLEALKPVRHCGKFPADPEASRMANIIEFSSDNDARFAKNILNAKFRVSFAQEYPVPVLVVDCSMSMDVFATWFGKMGDIKQLKCAENCCFVSYHDIKSACAALVYFSGRSLTANNQTYNLDVRFANDTGHIVWDKEFSRDYKKKMLEKRCFHLAYVLDLLEKEVYASDEERRKRAEDGKEKQLNKIAGDMEKRLARISRNIELRRQRHREKIEVDIETNEENLKNTIRDLERKNRCVMDQVQQVKSNLDEVNKDYRSLQCEKYTRKRITDRSLDTFAVEGTIDDKAAVQQLKKDADAGQREAYLQSRVEALQQQLTEFEKTKRTLKQVEHECESWRKKCEENGEKVQSPKSRNPSLLKGDANSRTPEEWREILEAKLKEHKAEISNYQEKVRSLEGGNVNESRNGSGDSQEVQKLKMEIDTLRKQLKANGDPNANDRGSRQLIELRGKLNEATKDLKEREEEIRAMREQLENLKLSGTGARPGTGSTDPARILLNMHQNMEGSMKGKSKVQEYQMRIEQLKVEIAQLKEVLHKKRKEIVHLQGHGDDALVADIGDGSIQHARAKMSQVLGKGDASPDSEAARAKWKKEQAILATLPEEIQAELLELRNHRELCVKLHGVYQEEEVNEHDVERLSRENSRPRSRSQTTAVVKKLIKQRDAANDENQWRKLLELEQRAHMDTKKRYRKEFQKVQSECERLQEQIDGKPRSRSRRNRNTISTAISRSTQTEAQTTTSGILAPPSSGPHSQGSFGMYDAYSFGGADPVQTSQQMMNLQQRCRFLEIQMKNLRERCDKETLRAEQNSKWVKILQAQKLKAQEKKRAKPMVAESVKLPPPKEKRAVDKKWKMTPSRFMQITKGEHAQRPLRTKAWLSRTIGEIYTSKRKADAVAIRENFDILLLPEFIYHEYLPSKLGIKDLVDATCWDIHNALQAYSKTQSQEVTMFRRFLEEDETIEVLSFYLSTREVVEGKLDRNNVLHASQYANVVESVFPQASCAWRFEMAESLELHAFALSGRPELDMHEALYLFIDHFKSLIMTYRTKCIKLFFHMGLNKQPNVEFNDFLPLIRVILSDVSADKLQAAICRLKPSKVGSMPIQQFLDTVTDLHNLRLQFHVPTCAPVPSTAETTLTKFVAGRWKKLQANMLSEIIELLGSISGEYSVLSPIRRTVCCIRDLSAHLNTCLVNGFCWEALTTFSHILLKLRNAFDMFDLATSGSDLKHATSLISNQETTIYKRVRGILDRAQEISDRSINKKPRFTINPNQRPSDERDRMLQKMVMEEFATNIHLRLNLTPGTKPRRQQAWTQNSAPNSKRTLWGKIRQANKAGDLTGQTKSPPSDLDVLKPFRGELRTADGPDIVKIPMPSLDTTL